LPILVDEDDFEDDFEDEDEEDDEDEEEEDAGDEPETWQVAPDSGPAATGLMRTPAGRAA
jgi:hypothetical protein